MPSAQDHASKKFHNELPADLPVWDSLQKQSRNFFRFSIHFRKQIIATTLSKRIEITSSVVSFLNKYPITGRSDNRFFACWKTGTAQHGIPFPQFKNSTEVLLLIWHFRQLRHMQINLNFIHVYHHRRRSKGCYASRYLGKFGVIFSILVYKFKLI